MADASPRYLPGVAVPYVAGAAIVGGQLLTLNASGQAVPSTAGSSSFVGVASHDVPAGDMVTAFNSGVQRGVASAAIAVGDPLKTAANGQLAVFVNGTDATTLYIGVAITAGAANALVDFVAR